MYSLSDIHRGRLIVLEGLDGASVFQQAARLAGHLRDDLDIKQVHLTREPSDGPVGSSIRLHLQKRLDVDNVSLAAFFAADRMDHLYKAGNGIMDRLKSGEYVISDRYYLSSLAYQSLDPNVDPKWLLDLNSKCPTPHLTIFVDVDPRNCARAVIAEKLIGIHFSVFDPTSHNLEALTEFLTKVREKYLTAIDLLREHGQRIEVVTRDNPPEIEREVRKIADSFIRRGS
jgi:dTMP kinase